MKLLPFALFAGPLLAAPVFAQVQLPVGSVSANQSFAVRSGSTFTAANLDSYAGKILVVMLMTPWCPFCQSNTISVGDGILDFFNASTRGALRGKNDHGVEIRSLLLSTEPASTWDATNASFSSAQGFQQWGLDAATNRTNPRVALGYYRGGFIPGNNLYDWGEDRRRLVVLNLVAGSASHQNREIVINQNFFDSSQNAAARAAINAVRPAPVLRTYTAWTGTVALPLNAAAAHHDPDGDQVTNLQEFFHGTNPLAATPGGAGLALAAGSAGLELTYQRANNLGGITVEHLVSTDLVTWTALPGLAPVATDAGDHERVRVPLPPRTGGPAFYRLRLTTN